MLAGQVPAVRACRKAKGPAVIESEDEVSEATSRAAQGRAKTAGHIRLVSPVRGASSVDGAEGGVFASGECFHQAWRCIQLTPGYVLGSGMKRRVARESPEAPAPKRVCRNVAPSDDREDLALVSGLIEDVKGAVIEASLAWRKVEDRIRAVEDWERGMRKKLRENYYRQEIMSVPRT